jgi:carbamoyl-phosphate synthase large subunit
MSESELSEGVLVTGAGGPAAVAVIRELVRRGIRVAAADSDPLSAGLLLADEWAAVPPYSDPLYPDQLCRLADKAGCNILVATLAEEIPAFHDAAPQLADAGLSMWLPSREAITACIDKWEFAQVTTAAGLSVPPTALGCFDGIPGPWIVKPRFGRGSQNIVPVDDPDGAEWALRRVPDPIVQTRLPGREFTVDALVDRSGQLAGAVPRWRLETRGGISVKGETFHSEVLVEMLGQLLKAVGLEGPANAQGFVDEDGGVTFIEVNPRFSGALPLSLAAGADLLGEYLRGVRGLPVRADRLRHRSGVRMVRYFDEIFLG